MADVMMFDTYIMDYLNKWNAQHQSLKTAALLDSLIRTLPKNNMSPGVIDSEM